MITISAREASLRRKVRRQLRSLGFHRANDGSLTIDQYEKEAIRQLHNSQRVDRLNSNSAFLDRQIPNLMRFFASGRDIEPSSIQPELERVYAGTWQSDLFRLASLTWSVPVSNGFGRRLRFIVWDRFNNKLIGLIAIGDPVFNLSVRDKLIGWSADDRCERLVNVMDAYVLGAMPPYNILLGGKMVACLVRTQQVYREFIRVYGDKVGIISSKSKNARLLSVTTSSSMGRSSVYNRLKLDGLKYFDPIGFTRGWGHFHISDSLFLELREYLRSIDHRYADHHNFGDGPNWRLRTTRTALKALGFKDDLLRHGIQREVFICNLATNALSILSTGKGTPDINSLLSVTQVADLSLDRWVLPRAHRRLDYRNWDRSNILRLLSTHNLNENARVAAN